MLSRVVWYVRRLFGARYGQLSIDVAARIFGSPGVFFFDVNSRQRYTQSHIPGAKNLVPAKVGANDLPPDRDAILIFYCGSSMCPACHEGAGRAARLGYKRVYIMPDGIRGWEKAALAVEKG